jgi:serine/threonine protein kinase
MKPLAQNTLIQNRYLIVQLIGKGGMGEVYLAVDQRLGSAVALKRTFFAGDEALASAFEREARILARMRHPVLPKVSDHFGEGGEQYLVMEHISGDDLGKRLEAAQKPFPVSWVMFWADQLLDALAYLHSHEPPIIHRDIKPQNLKLTDENHVILLDFGLSKSSTGQTNISGTGSSGSTGSVVGYTPHYAPMEQVRGIGTNPRSDIYSLSATLYQLLTNTVPVDALSRADALLNGSADPITPPSEINVEVTRAISDVILQGMEVSQEKRFASAKDMQRVLRKAYNEMQSAMGAETVAFAGGVDMSARQHANAVTGSAIASTSGSTSTPGATPEPEQQLEPDFGATVAFDQPDQSDPIRQADVKTEVFIAGSTPFSVPEQSEQPDPGASPAASPYDLSESGPGGRDDDFSEVNDFSPDATVPMIAFAGNTPDVPEAVETSGHDDFGESAVGDQPVPFATVAASGAEFQQAFDSDPQPEAAVQQQAYQPAKPVPAKKKGGAGKVIAILAGLFVLFVLAASTAGGVWYYYNFVAVEPEPTPSPSPSPTEEQVLTESPTPEPSPDEDASPSPEPTPEPTADITVGPTPAGTPQPRSTPVVRTTPQVRVTPIRPSPTPASKPTPRPRTPDILQ